MKNLQLFSKLEKEREELNRLIDEALENGTPIAGTREMIEQSRKVNDLVEIIQEEWNRDIIRER
jgi:hypothetical protein